MAVKDANYAVIAYRYAKYRRYILASDGFVNR